MFFLSSADFFQNQLFRKISFRNNIRVSNSLDPDQARYLFGPDLGPNCLQRLSAVKASIVRGDRDSRANLMPIYGDLYQIKL